MASYVGHLTFSSMLGAAVGGAGTLWLGMDWGPVFMGAGLTALGGLLPDLDSDSGVPVREMFGLAAVGIPLLLVRRLETMGFTVEQTLVVLAGLYLLIRYGISSLFKRYTVHRGIYHSIPAMLISGLLVFLCYESPELNNRLFVSGGIMIGFLSHLVLDELCSVDINGVKVSLNQFAGSAVKLFGNTWTITAATYTVLAALSYLAYLDYKHPGAAGQVVHDRLLKIPTQVPGSIKELEKVIQR